MSSVHENHMNADSLPARTPGGCYPVAGSAAVHPFLKLSADAEEIYVFQAAPVISASSFDQMWRRLSGDEISNRKTVGWLLCG